MANTAGWVDTSKPFNYNLEVLTLVNNEGAGFDIRKTFLGLKLHESITQNFLSGEVSIIDATGFLENAKLFGQETLRLRFSSPSNYPEDPVDKDTIDQIFHIYHVGEVQRAGQNTLIYNLRFCTPELIQAKRIRISRAYKGSLIETAGKLAKEYLDIVIEDPAEAQKAGGHKKLIPYIETLVWDRNEDIKVIIPNWTVNYAINWLCKEAQGRDDIEGLQDSWFFYQTAVGGYRIESISTMIQKSAAGTNFIFTTPNLDSMIDPTSIPWDHNPAEGGIIGMGKRIQAYEIGSIANVLEATVEGMFGSKQTTVFTTGQYMHETSFKYHEKFFGGKSSTVTGEYPLVRQEDEILHIGNAAEGDEDVPVDEKPYKENKSISDYTDANQVLTSQTTAVHDKDGTVKSVSDGVHMGTALFRQAAEQLLNYYTLNLVLPCRTDISAGTKIVVEIPQARPGESDETPALFHDGEHLVTDIMWELSLNECKVNVKCVKDSFNNEIETTKITLPPTIFDPNTEEGKDVVPNRNITRSE